jgi:hypothetical protein
MKVEVTVRGLEELNRELARLSGAVQTRLARNATIGRRQESARSKHRSRLRLIAVVF